MELSKKLQMIKSGWSTVYIEVSQVIISINIVFLFSNFNLSLLLANSADPDEIQHYVTFHLGL